ncbi:protein NATD1-like [Macrobrachium nipponense]|uniref:protein NATD1-like n=1 Tax=Macrobrachium nipponense TaxID=159736 RepID=UPI0030C8ADE2
MMKEISMNLHSSDIMSGRYVLRSMSRQTNRIIPGSRMTSTEVGALQVHHDENNMEFYIKLGKERAFLQYDVLNPVTGAVDLQHTVVPEVFQGQGIAKVLAKTAMDHFSTQNKQMKLTCWYLKKYYNENPSHLYEDRVIDN